MHISVQARPLRKSTCHSALHLLPIDRPTVVATLGGETIAGSPIDADLVRGVALGLVESAPDATTGEPKYFVSPIVAPRLAGELIADERTGAQGRAARHLHGAWASRGASEEESLEIVRLAVETRDSAVAVYAADRVAVDWINRSRFSDAEHLCLSVLEISDDFRVAHMLARAEEVLGKSEQALARYESVLAACPSPDAGTPPGVLNERAAILHNMAGLLAQQGQIDLATELLRQALEIEEQIGNGGGKAATLHQMAGMVAVQGQIERAMDLWRQALEIEEQIGDVRGKAATLHQMAVVVAQQGQIEHAMELWRQSLEFKEQIGDVRGKTVTLREMAHVLAQQGQIERAMELWRQALQLTEQIGDVRGRAATLALIAWAANNSGDLSEARRLCLDAAADFAGARVWPALATVLQNLSDCDEANRARHLAQALWLVLRLQSPSSGAVNAARLLQAIGVEAPVAPLLAATALWLAQREAGEQRSESQDLAQRMFAECAEQRGVAAEGAAAWAEREGLLDPARFLPELDRALEALVADDGWLFDRSLVDLPLGGAEAP